jgi:hypothetical protein
MCGSQFLVKKTTHRQLVHSLPSAGAAPLLRSPYHHLLRILKTLAVQKTFHLSPPRLLINFSSRHITFHCPLSAPPPRCLAISTRTVPRNIHLHPRSASSQFIVLHSHILAPSPSSFFFVHPHTTGRGRIRRHAVSDLLAPSSPGDLRGRRLLFWLAGGAEARTDRKS